MEYYMFSDTYMRRMQPKKKKTMFSNCVIKQQDSQETVIHSDSLKFLEFSITDTLILLR